MSTATRPIHPRSVAAAIAALATALIAVAMAPAALAAIVSSPPPDNPTPPAAPTSSDIAAAEARVDAFIASHQADGAGAGRRLGNAPDDLTRAVATSVACQREAGARVLEDPDDPHGYTASYAAPADAAGDADAARFSALLHRCAVTFERDAELAAHPERGPAGEPAFLDRVRNCAAEADVAIPELRVRADIGQMSQASWDAIFPCVAEPAD